MTLTNSTVSGNSAGQYSAGGVSNYAGMATLTNSTVSGNSAADRGGGVFNNGTLTLTTARCQAIRRFSAAEYITGAPATAP